MAFPLIPFVAGAVVGGLASYLYKDDLARKGIKKTAGSVTGRVKETTGNVTHKVSDSVSGLKRRFSGKEEAPVVEKKAATKKRTVKKRSVKKRMKKAPTTEAASGSEAAE